MKITISNSINEKSKVIEVTNPVTIERIEKFLHKMQEEKEITRSYIQNKITKEEFNKSGIKLAQPL